MTTVWETQRKLISDVIQFIHSKAILLTFNTLLHKTCDLKLASVISHFENSLPWFITSSFVIFPETNCGTHKTLKAETKFNVTM